MDSEERILEALQKLTEGMTEGFNSMGARFEAIESRLGAQERKTKKAARRQALQGRSPLQGKPAGQRAAAENRQRPPAGRLHRERIADRKYSPAAVLGEIKAQGLHFDTTISIFSAYQHNMALLSVILPKRSRKNISSTIFQSFCSFSYTPYY